MPRGARDIPAPLLLSTRPAHSPAGNSRRGTLNISPDFMRRIAGAAAAETLPRFRSQGAVVNKLSGGFDPVTEADREAERAIRALIGAEFPDHGILGE